MTRAIETGCKGARRGLNYVRRRAERIAELVADAWECPSGTAAGILRTVGLGEVVRDGRVFRPVRLGGLL